MVIGTIVMVLSVAVLAFSLAENGRVANSAPSDETIASATGPSSSSTTVPDWLVELEAELGHATVSRDSTYTTDESSFDAVVEPGEDIREIVDGLPAGSSILIKAGVHINQQVIPKTEMTFVGEDGAILDGTGQTEFAIYNWQNDGAENVTIRNLEVRNYATQGHHAALGGYALNLLVEDVHVHHIINGSGVRVTDGGVIRNVLSHHNDRMGLRPSGTGILVEGNTVYANNYRDVSDPGWDAGGMKSSGSDLVFRNNHIYDNHGPGIWIDIHAKNVLIEDNVIEGNTFSAVDFEISYRAVIRRNTLRNNGHGDTRVSPWSAAILIRGPDVEVYDNLIEGNKAGVGVIAQPREIQTPGESPVDPKNIHVYGNTFVNTGENGVVVWDGDPIAYETTRFSNNTYRYDDPNGEYFKFEGGSGDFAWWQETGQDRDSELIGS